MNTKITLVSALMLAGLAAIVSASLASAASRNQYALREQEAVKAALAQREAELAEQKKQGIEEREIKPLPSIEDFPPQESRVKRFFKALSTLFRKKSSNSRVV